MIDKVSLKKIITDFQKYSTNLMTTNYEESDVNFRRFKKFIDENELVNNIIMQKISGVTINYEDYFLSQNNSWGQDYSIPTDESEHLKAIYDYIRMIEKNNIALLNVAILYHCDSRKYVDIIHNFNEKIILPLIDYVNVELSKKLLEYDEFYPFISFSGNNSPVFFQSTGTQNVKYETNDTELFNLVLTKLDLLREEGVSKEALKILEDACKNKDKNKVINFLKDVASGTSSSLIATGILVKFGIQ